MARLRAHGWVAVNAWVAVLFHISHGQFHLFLADLNGATVDVGEWAVQPLKPPAVQKAMLWQRPVTVHLSPQAKNHSLQISAMHAELARPMLTVGAAAVEGALVAGLAFASSGGAAEPLLQVKWDGGNGQGGKIGGRGAVLMIF